MSGRRDQGDSPPARRSLPRGGKSLKGASRRRRGGKGAARDGAGLLPESAMPSAGVPRRLRVEGDLHQGLVASLAGLRDPRLEGTAITRVQMTDDLQLARIFVRLGATTQQGTEERKRMMQGLRAAKGRLRHDVARQLDLRYAPELRFVYDEGLEVSERIEEILAEIRREDTGSDSESDSESRSCSESGSESGSESESGSDSGCS